jgi:hypothetical protein
VEAPSVTRAGRRGDVENAKASIKVALEIIHFVLDR